MIAALVSTKFAGHDSLFFCFLALPMMGSTGKTTDGCFQGENEDSNNNAVHTKPPITRFANGERVSGGSVTAAVHTANRRPAATAHLFSVSLRDVYGFTFIHGLIDAPEVGDVADE
ncbi:hypothetical protein [Stieleria maiorica]|uniref:hypothetical protein n=1 Tax=Stieleria maiorica TaxID=2795974 RepID=UPI0011C89F86|nr:hypothetical protein [Stieleria maiorica]